MRATDLQNRPAQISESAHSQTFIKADVRSTPESGLHGRDGRRPLRAISRLMRCSKWRHYSITSSARSSIAGGMVRPSALAVWTLITSSILLG